MQQFGSLRYERQLAQQILGQFHRAAVELLVQYFAPGDFFLPAGRQFSAASQFRDGNPNETPYTEAHAGYCGGGLGEKTPGDQSAFEMFEYAGLGPALDGQGKTDKLIGLFINWSLFREQFIHSVKHFGE